MMAKQLSTKLHLAEDFTKTILKNFPNPTTYAFAYGSAVFPQQDQKPGKMMDLVFVVDDPITWHRDNLKKNFNHYSGIRKFGPKFIAAIQEKMACGIFYNPFINIDDKLIKYGVISTLAFQDDLTNWSSLYIAGRLQKPVKDLQLPPPNLITCIEKNRTAALRFALIDLPESTSTTDLYIAISKLSYTGDFRMYVGEHPSKAENIVMPLMNEFDKVYNPILKTLQPGLQLEDSGKIYHSTDPDSIFDHMMKLPYSIQCSLVKRAGRPPKYFCVEDTMADLSRKRNIKLLLSNEVSKIVFASSVLQTAQGIFSAGVLKSIRYGLEKLKKKVSAN